jgi:hypothetical protein
MEEEIWRDKVKLKSIGSEEGKFFHLSPFTNRMQRKKLKSIKKKERSPVLNVGD